MPTALPSSAPNKLEQLKSMTDVVADTGDIEAIEQFSPQDATTNPSLLLKAAALPRYAPLLREAAAFAAAQPGTSDELASLACDRFAVLVGREIAGIVPGRVSTEVDARLSFNTAATVDRAERLIRFYEEFDVAADRILIKIASTWEGIEAAEQLERRGINCNLTLLFSFEQALACAHAGAYLISPFVGRILDWYQNATGETYNAHTDPGVASLQTIYRYYKRFGFDTVVMGASFRNIGEIEALAGCDRLTIAPALLADLAADTGKLPRVLDTNQPGTQSEQAREGESQFRWSMNQNAMATEKLAEGIRNFAADQLKLEALLRDTHES